MIQAQTVVKVGDNSGVRYVRCIKVLGASKKRWAKLGEYIKASAIEVASKSKVRKGQVVNAIVTRLNRQISRFSEYVRFDTNAVAVLNEKFEPLGSRVFGIIAKEIKFLNPKVFAIASETI
ncbi:MAG: uL14 family ribosomal protein [Candidatus Hodgkinia cicadicola]